MGGESNGQIFKGEDRSRVKAFKPCMATDGVEISAGLSCTLFSSSSTNTGSRHVLSQHIEADKAQFYTQLLYAKTIIRVTKKQNKKQEKSVVSPEF